jgi:hypothetical protein
VLVKLQNSLKAPFEMVFAEVAVVPVRLVPLHLIQIRLSK